jgi:hypothetical protein
MQNGATTHTPKEIIRALRGVFGEMNGEKIIINKGF